MAMLALPLTERYSSSVCELTNFFSCFFVKQTAPLWGKGLNQLGNKMEEFLFNYISTATTTRVAEASAGLLHSITIGEAAAGAITISDNTGTIAVLKASAPEGTYTFDVAWNGFLEVVTAEANKLTVSYR